MTFGELIRKAVENGIISVNKTDYDERKKAAHIAGFNLCLRLGSIEQFQAELVKREEVSRKMIDRRVGEQEYWEYRWATGQIEHVYKILCAAYHFNRLPGYENLPEPYASGVAGYSRIVGVTGMTPEQVEEFWGSTGDN